MTRNARLRRKEASGFMADDKSQTTQPGTGPEGGEHERIPFMQNLLDNPFLLLFLGVAIPAVLYTIWGIMDIVMIPISTF